MNVLVANLGSTSFKYRLFRFAGEEGHLLAKGGYERVTDYVAAIEAALGALREGGCIASEGEIEAVGFKTVLGGDLTGCLPADDRVLAALEATADQAPAHNPAYAAGIRAFARRLPQARRVALFETAFFQWMPEARKRYAVPASWHEAGVRRNGFHGASHKFVAERSAQLLGRGDLAAGVARLYRDGPPENRGGPCRVISCHLGGSSSVTAIRDGVAIGCSLGMTPQSGLPHNNRVGDLDAGAIPLAMRKWGLSLGEVERVLSRESGLLGLSGVGNDIRDIKAAAAGGNAQAQLALDFFVDAIRHWVGAFFMEMGGAEAIVFTGGIGEHNPDLRAAVCRGWEVFGVTLDAERNADLMGTEGDVATAGAGTRVFVVPANEEIVIAREAVRLLAAGAGREAEFLTEAKP